ncbi:MAG: hypothetical protein JW727_01140 [Candidatus Aenigmarchaeota archaeon]|nr:hypothetical protein [Candidatus Aenigmarchaeota archaeon]
MAKGQVGLLERLGVCGFCDEIKNLTYLKTGIYQPKARYMAELSAYYLIAFMTPFFLFQSQFMLGTIVNSMLVTGALYTKGKEMLPVIFLPSIATLAQGVLFGSLTKYLLFMLPFIWIGNALLVYGIKSLHIKKKQSFVTSAAMAATVKAGFLLVASYTLFTIGVIPAAFLTAFGMIQLGTALAAIMVIWPIHSWRLKRQK